MARIRIVVAAATLASLATPARAQDIGRLQTELVGSGVPLGTFRVLPRFTFENYYDDNIFASESGVGDYVASIIPRLGVESAWSSHYLSLSAAGRLNRYANESTEDNDEYAIDIEGRLDLTTGSTLDALFGQGRQTMGRANSENTGRLDPQQLDYFQGKLGYEHQFARFDLELLGFADRLDFVDRLDDDRDRVEFGGTVRWVSHSSPALSLFVEPGVEVRDYDQKVDDTGLERSSVAIVGLAGAEFDITSVIRGEVAVGPVYVGFDESSFDDVVTVAVLGEARWDITRLTQLEAEVECLVLPTDVRGASSKIRTLASVQVRHELLRNLFLRADAKYFREKFKELGRTDDNFWLRAGAEYAVNRYLSIAAKYGHRLRDSNFSTFDLRQNLVMLSVDTHL